MSSNKILRRDKVVAELARHGQGARDVSLLHAASFMQRKRLCEANRCLDLAPVEFVLAQLGDVEMLDPRCLKEVAPHLLALGDVEVRIFKGYADARVEGRVKALDTVCRQE